MPRIPVFGKKKLILAFEYAVTLADVVHQNKAELTPEIVERMEAIILKEFPAKSAERLAIDMNVNVLAALEPKMA